MTSRNPFKVGDKVKRTADKVNPIKPSHYKGFEFVIGAIENEYVVVAEPMETDRWGHSAHNIKCLELVNRRK